MPARLSRVIGVQLSQYSYKRKEGSANHPPNPHILSVGFQSLLYTGSLNFSLCLELPGHLFTMCPDWEQVKDVGALPAMATCRLQDCSGEGLAGTRERAGGEEPEAQKRTRILTEPRWVWTPLPTYAGNHMERLWVMCLVQRQAHTGHSLPCECISFTTIITSTTQSPLCK